MVERSFSDVFPGFTAPEVSGKKHGKDSLRVHNFFGGNFFPWLTNTTIDFY